MKLEQYVTELCAKLRSGEEVKLEALIEMPYRHLMATVLINHLTGPASVVVEGLLNEVVQLQDVNSNCGQHIAHLNAQLEAASVEELKRRGREIQGAPNKGAIEQEKLDAAMQGLRKRRAEKKAAQKAKKDE